MIKMLATNKFGDSVKKWYDAQEQLCSITWKELASKLKEMFGELKDPARLREKMRARRWSSVWRIILLIN